MTKLRVIINGKAFDVSVEVSSVEQASAPNSFSFQTASNVAVTQAAPVARVAAPAPVAAPSAPVAAPTPKAAPAPVAAPAPSGAQRIEAPMAGVVMKVLVAPGQAVTAGQEVVVLEAMKMETPVFASAAGTVAQVFVVAGAPVAEGAPLLDIG